MCRIVSHGYEKTRASKAGACIRGRLVRWSRFADKLWVDFGPEIGNKKTSAQLTRNYRLTQMIGRQVAAVVNFPAKQIGRFMSEVLVLGFPDPDGEVVLVRPDRKVLDGGRLY